MRLPLFASVAGRLLRHEPRRRDGLRLASVTVALWARGRLGRGGRAVRIAVTAGGRQVSFLVWDYVDMLVVREIFLDGEYRLPDGLAPSTILDLGANTGIAVRYLRACFPAARVLAVEPDPANFRRLAENCTGDPAVTLVQAAAGAASGRATLYAVDEGWASSFTERADARPVEVDVLTVDDLLARAGWTGADLVKVDIEGGEWPLLRADALQAVTERLVGELHTDAEHTFEVACELLAGWDVVVTHRHGPAVSFTSCKRTADAPGH